MQERARRNWASTRDGGRADFGIGGLHAGGIGGGNGPGYYNLKLGSEAAADTSKQGFKVGREDEGIIQSSFLKIQPCKPVPDSLGFSDSPPTRPRKSALSKSVRNIGHPSIPRPITWCRAPGVSSLACLGMDMFSPKVVKSLRNEPPLLHYIFLSFFS